jgi:hypothetical protein
MRELDDLKCKGSIALARTAYNTHSYDRGIVGQQSIHDILIVRALLKVLAGGVLSELADLLHVSVHLPPGVFSLRSAALALLVLLASRSREIVPTEKKMKFNS